MDLATMMIAAASGVGGALATVGAFALAFKGLEKQMAGKIAAIIQTVDEMDKRVDGVDQKLGLKLDKTACERCHAEMEKEMTRGARHFDELFTMQRGMADGIGAVNTAVQLLGQKVDGFANTLKEITRIELRQHGG